MDRPACSRPWPKPTGRSGSSASSIWPAAGWTSRRPSLDAGLADVAERPAAALAGCEAGGAGTRLGLQRWRAVTGFVDQRLRDLEAPLLVGRAAIGAQARLREFGELQGQRPRLGQRLAFGHQTIRQAPVVGLARADL